MATFKERNELAQNTEFRDKVKIAANIAANDLLADPQQPLRVRQYAGMVVSNADGNEWLSAISYGVVANPAISAESTDSDIQFTVNSIMVKYAYAYYRELPE